MSGIILVIRFQFSYKNYCLCIYTQINQVLKNIKSNDLYDSIAFIKLYMVSNNYSNIYENKIKIKI